MEKFDPILPGYGRLWRFLGDPEWEASHMWPTYSNYQGDFGVLRNCKSSSCEKTQPKNKRWSVGAVLLFFVYLSCLLVSYSANASGKSNWGVF